MSYKYTHFIPENTAPRGAKRIGVYQGERRICTVPLGRLAPVEKAPLYSFGLLSDIHLWKTESSWGGNAKFDNALSYFESQGLLFCAHCGDITQTGLYDEGDKTTLQPGQFEVYKQTCDKYSIPVYGICGNHESYVNPITNNPDELKYYTGTALTYTISSAPASEETVGTTVRPNVYAPVGDDLFIMIGQPSWTGAEVPMSDADFAWLQNVLASNTHRRCFVFIHSYIEEDSGDAHDVRENSMFDHWSKTAAFMALLAQYPNAILFHGHSHMKLENQLHYDSTKPLDKDQESYKAANYTEKNGFKSVHVPSCATPRDINFDENESENDNDASEGYIVDVHDDCIVLKGMDLVNQKLLVMGTYKIDTLP